MNVKKCAALLLSAVFAVLALAGCGRDDYSTLAAKTVNEAQGQQVSVYFDTDQKFTDALWDALEEKIQVSDVQQAMAQNSSIQELLKSRYSLTVYAANGKLKPEDAANQIAQEILKILSGKQKDGFISMVKADNNYYYVAVLTYRTGGSNSGSNNNTEDNEKPTIPEEPDSKPEEPQWVTWNAQTGTLTFKAGAAKAIGNTTLYTSEFYTNKVKNALIEYGDLEEGAPFSYSDVIHLITEEGCGFKTIADNNNFKDNTKLKTIELNDIRTINSSAFEGCTSLCIELNRTTLPDVQLIGYNAFKNTGITAIDLPNFNPQPNHSRDYAFSNCKSLVSVNLPDATSIGISVFEGCTSLKNVTLPEVTEIDPDAFKNTAIEKIALPSATVLNGSVFENCTKLTSVELPKIEHINNNYCFDNCTNLTHLRLGDTLQTIDYAFIFGSRYPSDLHIYYGNSNEAFGTAVQNGDVEIKGDKVENPRFHFYFEESLGREANYLPYSAWPVN
ncbi:hypothetical protein B5G12_03825 [Faecalibacterium sp. An58]|uniref:leucine-rich repeat domain-containing protein n=1 Tax=Faecalibacterium sp. An58 TaxID=1965648 RepID=UPI000B38B45A|nr:leucine-rich repeat domain-containing protein [Faecalibacterium sp. An58]OUN74915.1 hypothetical protein B5G12_03825 [Faecalibacterium sp. An58]